MKSDVHILFVLPPYHPLVKSDAVYPDFILPMLVGATVLKQNGYGSRIIDMSAMKLEDNGLFKTVQDCDPPIIVINSFSYGRFIAIDLIKHLKGLFPEKLIVGDGLHFKSTVDDAFEKIPELDAVIMDRDEEVVLNLARAVEEGGEYDDILGLRTRDNVHSAKQSNSMRPTKVLDIPIVDRSFVQEEHYNNHLMLSNIRSHVIKGSLGCPFRCKFCVWGSSQFRSREIDSVIEEMEMLYRQTGNNAFTIWDATFTAVPKRIVEFCEKVLRKGLSIQWSCDSRVSVDREILKLMADAGCYSLSYGVESGSPRILKAIDKKITVDKVISFARHCHELDIKAAGLFMYSLPGETIKDVQQTIALVKEVLQYSQSICANLTLIYPGTHLETIAKERGVLPKDFSWNTYYYSDISKRLGVFPEIPVYIEKLSVRELELIRVELGTYWLTHEHDFSFKKLLKTFIREIKHNQFDRDFFYKMIKICNVMCQRFAK